MKTAVAVSSGGTTLSVPILCMLAAAPAGAPVAWDTAGADVDVNGTSVIRSLVNAGATPAPFVASVRAPWISVESLDGLAWDRPLAPFETRPVRLVIDRARRRAETGTEVGAIVLSTVGFDTPRTLLVTDDGPRILPAATGSAAVPAAAAKTRVLYASFPNALDAKGIGRFAADLWLTNTDVVNPVTLSLLFNPVGGPGDGLGAAPLRHPDRAGRDAPLPQRRRDAARRRRRVHRGGPLLGADAERDGRSSRTQPFPRSPPRGAP